MSCPRHPDGDGPDWCMDCHPEKYARDLPHARHTDPDTSQSSGHQTEAKEGTTTTFRPRTQKHLALWTLHRAPMTAREVGREARRPEIWKRVSDLKNAGLIEDTGERRFDPETGRPGIVWRTRDPAVSVLWRLGNGETVHL